MKISVVIPAYNAATTIRDAIESSFNQTLQPHEIIVVDDCSTDNTRNIVQEYKTVTLLRQEQNAGPSAARNLGWDEATGDIIAFLDADDTWLPEKLRVLQKLFSEQPNLQYVGHPYMLPGETQRQITGELSAKSYLSILLKNPYQPSCIVVRKNISERFDESYRYCEDHELSIRIAYTLSCYWLDQPLTRLGRPQLSTGGASGNVWKMRKGELRLYSSIYRHNPLYAIFIPFLWIFSLGKMVGRLIFR